MCLSMWQLKYFWWITTNEMNLGLHTHTHTDMLIDLWRKISARRDAVIHDDMMIQNMHACLHNDASSTCGICNFLCVCVYLYIDMKIKLNSWNGYFIFIFSPIYITHTHKKLHNVTFYIRQQHDDKTFFFGWWWDILSLSRHI